MTSTWEEQQEAKIVSGGVLIFFFTPGSPKSILGICFLEGHQWEHLGGRPL